MEKTAHPLPTWALLKGDHYPEVEIFSFDPVFPEKSGKTSFRYLLTALLLPIKIYA